MSPEEQDRVVAARSEERHSDFGFVEFPTLPTVDGLISAAEQRYLYWLTSTMFADEGAIVELGSWFGRSAMALGAGLRDSGRTTTLHCFDRFRWSTRFADSVKIAKVTLPEGGDFKPYFVENVVQVYPHVDATKTTIEELTWDRGPIELLFIDAPKTFADLSRALLTFGPDLSVGRSLLILQDFFFTPAYPIALTVACMAESVELVHTVSGSSTAAFVLRSALPTDVPRDWKYWDLDDARLIERWQKLLGKLPDDEKSLLDPALAFYYLDRGRVADAKRHMHQIDFSEFGRRRIDFLRSSTAWGPRVTTMLER